MTDAVLGISSGVKRCVRNVQRWNCLQCVAEELPVASDGIFSELECGPVDILDVGFVTGCPRLSLPTILAAAQFDVTFGDVTQRCSSSLCPGHRTVTQSAGKLLSGSQRFNWPDWSCTAATTGLHTEIHTHTHTHSAMFMCGGICVVWQVWSKTETRRKTQTCSRCQNTNWLLFLSETKFVLHLDHFHRSLCSTCNFGG